MPKLVLLLSLLWLLGGYAGCFAICLILLLALPILGLVILVLAAFRFLGLLLALRLLTFVALRGLRQSLEELFVPPELNSEHVCILRPWPDLLDGRLGPCGPLRGQLGFKGSGPDDMVAAFIFLCALFHHLKAKTANE